MLHIDLALQQSSLWGTQRAGDVMLHLQQSSLSAVQRSVCWLQLFLEMILHEVLTQSLSNYLLDDFGDKRQGRNKRCEDLWWRHSTWALQFNLSDSLTPRSLKVFVRSIGWPCTITGDTSLFLFQQKITMSLVLSTLISIRFLEAHTAVWSVATCIMHAAPAVRWTRFP